MLTRLDGCVQRSRAKKALSLVCGEYLLLFVVLAIFHDGPVLWRLPGWWRLLIHSTTCMAALAVAVAAFAITRATDREPIEPIHSDGTAPLRDGKSALVAHALGYVCCFALVFYVFARPEIFSAAAANISFLAWIASGTISLLGLYVWASGSRSLRVGALRLRPRVWGYGIGLAALAWFAALTTQLWWADLAPYTLRLSGWVLSRWLTDVVIDPTHGNLIGAPGFVARIDNECSGTEGVGLITAFLAGHVLLFRKQLRFPQALLLFPIGAILAYLLNIVRLVVLIGIGAMVSPEVAKGGFHSNAGWILFCALSVGIVLSTQHWSFVYRRREQHVAARGEVAAAADDGTTAYLLPLVSLLATGLVTGAFVGQHLDRAYALRGLIAGTLLYLQRKHYRELKWQVSPLPVAVGVVVAAMWLWLPPHDLEAQNIALQTELEQLGTLGRPIWLILRIVGSSLVVPIAEELAFRGYLQRRLIARDWSSISQRHFSWLSFLVTAISFGALHASWLAGTLAGAGFALATYVRGRLADAVIAHAVANSLLCAWAVATGEWAVL